MDKVSVIIPAYNCAERLMQALASVVSQAFGRDHIVVLVIDDGSTDNTGDRVAEFIAHSDLGVRYVRQQKVGPAATRNHGMRLSKGNALAFLDDDDSWFPTKLGRQLPLLNGNLGLAYCDNAFVDAAGNFLTDYVRRIGLVRGDAKLALCAEFFLLTSAVCMRRSLLDRVGYFGERPPVGEGYDFFLRVATCCEFDLVHEKLIVRSVWPDSLSRRYFTLDCETDLATLARYLAANLVFAARNRTAVRRRLANYRCEFGYSLLKLGRRRDALAQLLWSMSMRPSLRAAKACVRSLLPQLHHTATTTVSQEREPGFA